MPGDEELLDTKNLRVALHLAPWHKEWVEELHDLHRENFSLFKNFIMRNYHVDPGLQIVLPVLGLLLVARATCVLRRPDEVVGGSP